jgi:hypothetical protein
VVKCFIRHAQLDQDRQKLKNVEQVVEFLRANLTSCLGHKQEVSQKFWHVTKFAVDVLRDIGHTCVSI